MTFGIAARRRRGVLASACGALVSLCAAACANTSGDTNVVCRPLQATSADRLPGWTGTVFTIVMENRDRWEILGNPDAPTINALAADNAVAAGYHDAYVHPSEPNYLWMVAGQNFGILDDAPPGVNVVSSTAHIADQIERAGLTWKAYEESMGEPCGLASHGDYNVVLDPFAFFEDIDGWDGTTLHPTPRCAEHLVDYTELDQDLATGNVPDYVFITPNLVDNMHNGTVAEGDAWLARELPKILASDAYRHGGVLFLLWDEGSSNGDQPPFLAVSPNARRGFVSHADYDTSSYLKTVQKILGLEVLPCSLDPNAVASMDDLFSVPLQR